MQQLLFVFGLIGIVLGLLQLSNKKLKVAGILSLIGFIAIILSYLLAPPKATPLIPVSTIKIRGSKTIGAHLMPELIKAYVEAEGYQLKSQVELDNEWKIVISKDSTQSLLEIVILSDGSSNAKPCLMQQLCAIGMSSERFSEAERKALGDHSELLLAFDAIKVIVHPSLAPKIDSIGILQLKAIFRGEISNWSALIPKLNQPIRVYTRDNKSGTFHLMEHLFEIDSSHSPAHLQQFDFFEKIAQAVESDSFAIGFVNYSTDPLMLQNVEVIGIADEKGKIHLPLTAEIQNGSYRLAQPLYLYKRNLPANNGMSEFIDGFLLFCKSKKAIQRIGELSLIAPN